VASDWQVGADGRFDRQAEPRSLALQFRTSTPPVAAVAVATAGLVGVAAILKRLGDAVAP
jgi:hypothetical protein